jgi:hypothetical protein
MTWLVDLYARRLFSLGTIIGKSTLTPLDAINVLLSDPRRN